MKQNTLLAAALLLFAACTGKSSSGSASTADSTAVSSADSLTETPVEARMITGFVGTGTSMNVIELVSAEADDTLWLELDEQTTRDATLEVGREIVVLVTDEPDGSQRVLATMDADEER